jgi:hypothetical protein
MSARLAAVPDGVRQDDEVLVDVHSLAWREQEIGGDRLQELRAADPSANLNPGALNVAARAFASQSVMFVSIER